ncbi:MAG: TetR/AcrR family transcriptional regulator [Anaerorhabdus sp.]
MARSITNNKILEESLDIFCAQGISKTTIKDIADAVGISRRTIYRYFSSKEDIAYEIMLTLMKTWNEQQHRIFDNLVGNGLEKIEQHFIQLKNYMKNHLDMMRFMSEYDHYFKDNFSSEPQESIKLELQKLFLQSDVLIEKLIKEGIADSSIEIHDKQEVLVATLTNALWTFAQAISVRGTRLSEEANVDSEDLICCLINVYISALRKR